MGIEEWTTPASSLPSWPCSDSNLNLPVSWGGQAGVHTPHPPPVVTGNWPGSVHPTSVGMFHSTGGLFPSSWLVRDGWGHCSIAHCEPLEHLVLTEVTLPPPVVLLGPPFLLTGAASALSLPSSRWRNLCPPHTSECGSGGKGSRQEPGLGDGASLSSWVEGAGVSEQSCAGPW